jgi:phosphinothricin acetyltransferase
MDFLIDDMKPDDWPAVSEIYLDGIATGDATFETSVPEWKAWDADHRHDCRLVARPGNRVVGWAALSPVSDRCVYGGVGEVSVYVRFEDAGRGIGKALLGNLIERSESQGLWTLQAGIFPENTPSVALHLNHGFRQIGRRVRIGQINGVWRDVLLFERRSRLVGT